MLATETEGWVRMLRDGLAAAACWGGGGGGAVLAEGGLGLGGCHCRRSIRVVVCTFRDNTSVEGKRFFASDVSLFDAKTSGAPLWRLAL